MNRALTGICWERVAQRLLSGLVHDLRGRASALGGLEQLVDDEDTSPAWFRKHFVGELARLQETIELLPLLRGSLTDPPRPLSLGEALPPLVSLWSRGADRTLPAELDYDPDAPPVRVQWTAFRRAFLILVHEAEARARAVRAPGLRIRVTAGEGEARIGVAWRGENGGEAPGEEESREGCPTLSELVGSVGGRLEVQKDGSGFEARFPALGAS